MRETWLDDLQARLGRKTFRVSVQKPPLTFKHAAFTSSLYYCSTVYKNLLAFEEIFKVPKRVQVALF